MIKVPNTDFVIKFSHQVSDVTSHQLNQGIKGITVPEHRAVTTCKIEDGATGLLVSEKAFCSWEDNFCKETGRKVALTRALKHQFPNNKYIRTLIWNAYHKRNEKNNS